MVQGLAHGTSEAIGGVGHLGAEAVSGVGGLAGDVVGAVGDTASRWVRWLGRLCASVGLGHTGADLLKASLVPLEHGLVGARWVECEKGVGNVPVGADQAVVVLPKPPSNTELPLPSRFPPEAGSSLELSSNTDHPLPSLFPPEAGSSLEPSRWGPTSCPLPTLRSVGQPVWWVTQPLASSTLARGRSRASAPAQGTKGHGVANSKI